MKFKERIGCGAVVVATLVEAQEQVRLLVQSLVPPPEKPIQLERGLGVVEKKHR